LLAIKRSLLAPQARASAGTIRASSATIAARAHAPRTVFMASTEFARLIGFIERLEKMTLPSAPTAAQLGES
jgi:hypothetical protein